MLLSVSDEAPSSMLLLVGGKRGSKEPFEKTLMLQIYLMRKASSVVVLESAKWMVDEKRLTD